MDNREISEAYGELGPTRRSTSSGQRVPPKIARIIAELGLRYRPSVQADLEAHGALLALLTTDVAHLDPAKLEVAAAEWARTQKFMPKAAELIDLTRKLATDKHMIVQANVDRGNARLAEQGRTDIRWVIEGGSSKLVAV